MNSKSNIQQLETRLRQRRDALRRSLQDDLSLLGTDRSQTASDPLDKAADDEFQSLATNLLEIESRELAQVERALERIQAGEYGKCERCRRTIPVARLKVIPDATMCVKCQEQNESQAGHWRLPVDWRAGSSEPDDWQRKSLELL